MLYHGRLHLPLHTYVILSVLNAFIVGLDLVLYSEDYEYIDELAMARGFRVDIHPYGTYPNLQEQGISLETGKQTYIGLKMVLLYSQ